jgi:hypothetical protein
VYHRALLSEHVGEKKLPCEPPLSCWVVLLEVEAYMEPVDICFKILQGLTTITSEQDDLLHSLVSSLRALLVIKGLLSPTSLSFKRNSVDDSNVLGAKFATTKSNVADFIADLGSFALRFQGNWELEDAQSVQVGTCKMFLATVEKISAISAERNSSNGPSSQPLPPERACKDGSKTI